MTEEYVRGRLADRQGQRPHASSEPRQGRPEVRKWPEGSDWIRDAACGDTDPDLFTDEYTGNAEERRARQDEAKAICARCPVQAPCRRLIDAIERTQLPNYWSSIWAGETVAERRRRRARSGAKPLEPD